MSFNFLLQATRVLHINEYDEMELKIIYEYITSLETDTFFNYLNKCTVIGYTNDLELYIDIVNAMIMIFEENEEYEKCQMLKLKREECEELLIKFKN